MRIQWNQVYNAFHQLGIRLGGPSKTNKVVCGNSNVILMRQTCGHSSSRVAGVKHQALAFYYSIQIWYVFLPSICKGESDLGLFTTSGLAKRIRLHAANFQFKNVCGRKIRQRSALHSRILFASTEVMPVRTTRSDSPSPLHFKLMLRTNTKYMCKNKKLAFGVCFPQPCSSAGRRFAASRSRLNHYQTIGSFIQGQFDEWPRLCKLNCSLVRIKPYPALISIFNLNLFCLFPTHRGKKDIDNLIIDWDLRMKKWHSKCNRPYDKQNKKIE